MMGGNPVHPSSSIQVYNQTTPIAMVHLPYANRLRSLPCWEMEVILVIKDAQGQKESERKHYCFFCHNCRSKNQWPMRRGPWHFLLKNVGVYACVSLRLVLLLSVAARSILFVSWNYFY